MAGRGAAGHRRWGDEERRLVFQYLQNGQLDPNRIESAAYLRSIKVREDIWDRHENKNFYQNVRRQVTTWLAAQERGGGRRGGNDGNEAEEAEEAEEDDVDPPGIDDEVAPPARAPQPQARAPPIPPRRECLCAALCACALVLVLCCLSWPANLHFCYSSCTTGTSSS